MRRTITCHSIGAVLAAILVVSAVGCGVGPDEQYIGARMVGDPKAPVPKDAWSHNAPSLERGSLAMKPAPEWVTSLGKWTAQQGGDMVYFVGRSVGLNVLDERAAFDAARDDAQRQMARQIATRVVATVTAGGKESLAIGPERDAAVYGPVLALFGVPTPWPPGARSGWYPYNRAQMAKACTAVTASALTDAVVGDLEEKGVYWEKWYVNERPKRPWAKHRGQVRYKCWVLMGVSKQKLQDRVELTGALLRTEGATRAVQQQAAAEMQVIDKQSAAKAAAIGGI